MRNTLRVITLVVIAALAATALPFVSTASAGPTTDEGAGTPEGDPAYCVRVENAAGFPVPGAEVVAKAFFPAFRAASDARSAVTNASGEARIELPPSSTYLVTIEDPYGWYADTNVDDHGRRLYAHGLDGNCNAPVQVTLEERWPVGYLTAVLADATFQAAPRDLDAPDAVAEVLAPVDAGALTVKRTSLASLRTAFETVADGAEFEQDVRYRFRAEPGSESNITLACPDAKTLPGAPHTFSVRVGGAGFTPVYVPIEAGTCNARALVDLPDLSLYRMVVPVNGKLVVESTGAPAAGATVTATLTKGTVATGPGSPYVLTAVTDAHGEFTLRVPWLEDGEAVFEIVAERNGLASPVFEFEPRIEDVDGEDVSLKIPSVRVTAAPRVRAYAPAEDVTYADGVRTCLKPASSEANPDCWVTDANGARPADAGGACIEVPPEPHEVTITDPEGRFEPRRFTFTFTEPAVPIACDGSTLPDTTLTSNDWMLLDVGKGLVTGRTVDAVATSRAAIDPSVPFVQIARDGQEPACASGLDGRFECLLPLPKDEVVGAQSVGGQNVSGISRGHHDTADVEISSGAEFPDHYASQTLQEALRLGVVTDVGDVQLERKPVTLVLNLTGRFSDNESTPLPPESAAPTVRHAMLPEAGVACEVTGTEAPSTAFYECKSPQLVWDGAPTFLSGGVEEARAWAPEPFDFSYQQLKRGAYYPAAGCAWNNGILPGGTGALCTAVAQPHERIVAGIVRDAHNATPLAGVQVKVVKASDGAEVKPDASKDDDCLAERYVCITTSAADGSFELRVPGLPSEAGYCVDATGPTGYEGSGVVCLDGGTVDLFRRPVNYRIAIWDEHARVVVPELFVNATLPAAAGCGNASAPNYVCSQTTPVGLPAWDAGIAGVAALQLPWGFPFTVTVADAEGDTDDYVDGEVHYFAYRTRPVNDGETTVDTATVFEPAFENVGPLDKERFRNGRLTNPTQWVSVHDTSTWLRKTAEVPAGGPDKAGATLFEHIYLPRARETLTVHVESSGGTDEETPTTVRVLPRYYPAWATPRTFCDPHLEADGTSVCDEGAIGALGDILELEVPIVRAKTPSVDDALEANADEPNGSWHLLATADGHYSGAIVGVDADDAEQFAFSLVPRSLEKRVNFTLTDGERDLEPEDAPNLVVCVFPLDSRLDGLDVDPVATLQRPVDDLATGTDLERLGARCRSGHDANFLVKWTRIVRQNDVQERQFGFVVDGTPEYAPTTGSFNVTAADDAVEVEVDLVPVLAAVTGEGAASGTLRTELPCDGSGPLTSPHDAWITRILKLAGPVPRDAVTPCTGGAAE